jgi:peptide/nickel transport system ATP-binding protein/oligopeptide transport system ATP-binding protein
VTLLDAHDLTKSFRRKRFARKATVQRAVDNVSLSLDAGRTLAIVGESGAGKSTIARLLLRLIEPDSGTITCNGVDLMRLSRKELRAQRRHMQMIFQDPYSSLDPRYKVRRSVAEPLKVHFGMSKADRERRAVEVMDRVGLGTHLLNRYPSQLSGGQLQRIAIARALSLEPKLLVCDEAVAALDVSVRAQVLNLLMDLQEELGISYLFIAHDLSIVQSFAHDVIVMKDGRAVEAGPTAAVFAAPSDPYTKELLLAVPGSLGAATDHHEPQDP